jgi:hypothetical protein
VGYLVIAVEKVDKSYKNSSGKLNSFEGIVQRAATETDRIGSLRSKSGKTVRELFVIDGLSMWDVLSVEMALYRMPEWLSGKLGSTSRKYLLQEAYQKLKSLIWRPQKVTTLSGNNGDVLFLGFTWYMAREVLIPVCDILEQDKILKPILLTHSFHKDQGELGYVEQIGIYRSRESLKSAERIGKKVRKAWRAFNLGKNAERDFRTACNRSWRDLRIALLQSLKINAGYILPDTISLAFKILLQRRPAAIVSIDVADPRTRIFTLIAKQLRIPTIQIQSGPIDPGCAEWFFCEDDHVLVHGKAAKSELIKHCVSPEKIIVTGSPKYDDLKNASEAGIRDLRKRFNIPNNNKIVVLASIYSSMFHTSKEFSTADAIAGAMKKAVFQSVSRQKNIFLIVKPHPLENIIETKSLITDFSNISFAESEENIRPFIQSCDALFTFGSTATIDGIILGKPIVCPVFNGWIFSDFFVKSGAVATPSSELEIDELLLEIERNSGEEIIRKYSNRRTLFLDEIIKNDGTLEELKNKANALLLKYKF